MNAYIGVAPNPFYAVTDGNGSFTIANVPAGKRTVSVWHERYGMLTGTVDVKPGQMATLELAFSPNAPARKTAVRELVVPGDTSEVVIRTGATE
jgi:hypothetical protein